MKLAYQIFKYLIIGSMVLILIFTSIFLFKGLVLKEDPVDMFGVKFFSVATGSMEPEICVGDLVVVVKKDADHYEEGMVVTYQLEGMAKPITHKVVKRDGDMITTQGVFNNHEDKEFHVSNILGEVVFTWKEYYKFSNFMRSPIGMIIVILGGFVLIEGLSILDKVILKKKS